MFIRKKKPAARKRIAVGGACRGCGVSFVCASLAYGYMKAGERRSAQGGLSVCVAELGAPSFYTAFDMASRPLSGPFESFSENMRSMESVSAISNMIAGINWLARHPGEPELSGAEMIRAVNSLPDGIDIIDCSGLEEPLLREVFASCDHQILVIDPMPSRLYGAYDVIGRFRLELPDGRLLVNRMNPGVHRSELTSFLGTSRYFELPSVPDEFIYRAEYSCSPYFEQKKAALLIEQQVIKIVESL